MSQSNDLDASIPASSRGPLNSFAEARADHAEGDAASPGAPGTQPGETDPGIDPAVLQAAAAILKKRRRPESGPLAARVGSPCDRP